MKMNHTFAMLALLFSVFAITALLPNKATAAPTATLYAPVPGTVTWEQGTVTAEVSNYQGSDYEMFLQYQPAGDTMYQTAQATYTFDWPQVTLTGLPANKLITVRAVVIDGTDTVTSNAITFTTLPPPHKAYIANVNVLTSPEQGMVTFAYNVAVVPTIFFVRYDNYTQVSDTFVVNTLGSGTGAVNLINPYAPGASYAGNWLRGRSVSGIVPDSTVTLGTINVPDYTQPDVSNTITFTNVTQDSFKFSASIDLGNASTGVITVRDLDSNGVVLNTRPLILTSSDTTITLTRTGSPYTVYGERIIVTTNGGSDSVTATKRTAQILSPDVVSVDTVNAAATTTDLTVVVKTNGKAAWSTSDATVKVRYKNSSNATITTPAQVVSGDPNATTLTFTGLSNLKLNPNSNTATVVIENGAGLVDSMVYTFKLRAPQPAVPIDNGFYVDAGNAFQIRVWHVNAGPSTLPYDVIALINVMGSGSVDTFTTRANQTGFTDFLQWDTIGNRTGNTAYQVRLGTRNSDGVLNITTSQTVTTVPAAPPSFFISNSINPGATNVSYRFMGCANGTPSYARVEVYEKWDMYLVGQVDLGYLGTGNFDVSNSFTGLTSCTDHQLKVILHDGQLGNQTTQEKDFETDCATGVDNIAATKLQLFPNPVSDMLNITATREIGECQLFSAQGALVATYELSNQTQAQISCADLPIGMYILKGNGFAQRFVKQ